jgi:hypothetical protein
MIYLIYFKLLIFFRKVNKNKARHTRFGGATQLGLKK